MLPYNKTNVRSILGQIQYLNYKTLKLCSELFFDYNDLSFPGPDLGGQVGDFSPGA